MTKLNKPRPKLHVIHFHRACCLRGEKIGIGIGRLFAQSLVAPAIASFGFLSSRWNLSPPDAKTWEAGDKCVVCRRNGLRPRKLRQKCGGD